MHIPSFRGLMDAEDKKLQAKMRQTSTEMCVALTAEVILERSRLPGVGVINVSMNDVNQKRRQLVACIQDLVDKVP